MPDAWWKMILVVDNDVQFLDDMGNFLADSGYDCIATTDPLEALKIADMESGLNMMVCDYRLPVLNGVTLIQQAQQINPGIRAVIMAESGDMNHVPDSMSLLSKPVAFKAFALMLCLS